MKKVIHFLDVLNIGGAQTQLLSVLGYLDRIDHEHIVYSMTDKMKIAHEFIEQGFLVKSLNLQNELRNKKWVAIARKIIAMLNTENADIIEMHQIWARIFIPLVIPWVHKKPRLIAVIQGEESLNKGLYRIANFIASLFISRLITCSNYFKEWLVKYYWIPARKISVMYNTVSLEVFKPEPGRRQKSRNEFGVNNDEIAIVSVGVLGLRTDKGMQYCIDAIGILRKKYGHIKLIIVGEGKRRGDLERQIEDLGLKEIVRLLGFRRDIPYVLEAADIFVLASPFEPFGIVFIEAMAMEKPVVGCLAGGIPEIIKDNLTGRLVEPRDPQALAKALETLIVDKELRLKMGRAAKEDVAVRFGSIDYARKLQSIYEKS